MTTTHKLERLEDGRYTYRGISFKNIGRSGKPREYSASWIRSIPKASTIKVMMANIDAYQDAEEKAYKPVLRRDGTYCSPRCGYKCTKADYDEAHRNATALAARMGAGWKPRVWENCMWHYGLEFEIDGVSVTLNHGYEPGKAKAGHREGIDEYSCYLNTNPQFIGSHTDPVEAFRQAREMLIGHVAHLSEVASILGAGKVAA